MTTGNTNAKAVRVGGLWNDQIEGRDGGAATKIQKGKVDKAALLGIINGIEGGSLEMVVYDYSSNKRSEKSPDFAFYLRKAYVKPAE
jgi:hypothetical protein